MYTTYNRIREIIDVYNFKKIEKCLFIYQGSTTLIRKARKVVVGSIVAAIGFMPFLVSIFTSNELMHISSADDSGGAIY